MIGSLYRLCAFMALAMLAVMPFSPSVSLAKSRHKLAPKQIEVPSGAILQIEHIRLGKLVFKSTADKETGKQAVVRFRIIKPAPGKSTYNNFDELLLSWFAVTKLSARVKFVHLQITMGSGLSIFGAKAGLFRGATYERDAKLGWGDMDLARSRPVKPLSPDTLKTIPLGSINGRELSAICLARNFAPLLGGATRAVMLVASPAHKSEKEFLSDVGHLLARDKIACKGSGATMFFIRNKYEGLQKFKIKPGDGAQLIAIPVGDHWVLLQIVMLAQFQGDGTKAIMVRFYAEGLNKTSQQIDSAEVVARELFDGLARDTADRLGLNTVVMLALKPFEAFQGMRFRYGVIFRKRDGEWRREKNSKKK